MFSKIKIIKIIPLILKQLNKKYITYSKYIFKSLKKPQNK